MRAHRPERPPPADVLVQFVLQIDERVVALQVEADVPQDGSHNIGTHL